YSAPVGMLKRSHHFPRLVFNSAGAFTTDTAYRIRPFAGTDAASLVFSFINSLTALSAELEGRQYGGGVLELVPSEIERLLIPYAEVSLNQLRKLDRAYRERRSVDELLKRQDAVVLSAAGFTKTETDLLRAGWHTLAARRQRLTE